MGKRYILDGKRAVECGDLMTWAKWFENAGNRRVADETIDGVRVSTVFLSLDYSFGDGPPMLFETMVFGGSLDQEQDRCTTWDEAEAMHEAMVARVKGANDAVQGREPALSAKRPSGTEGSGS
jgi:hypothetical protein